MTTKHDTKAGAVALAVLDYLLDSGVLQSEALYDRTVVASDDLRALLAHCEAAEKHAEALAGALEDACSFSEAYDMDTDDAARFAQWRAAIAAYRAERAK